MNTEGGICFNSLEKLSLKLPRLLFGSDLVSLKCLGGMGGREGERSRERQRTTPNEFRITRRLLAFVAAFFKLSCLSYVNN